MLCKTHLHSPAKQPCTSSCDIFHVKELMLAYGCEECHVKASETKTRICCCDFQEKDLKLYMEECGNILNINNVKVMAQQRCQYFTTDSIIEVILIVDFMLLF